MAAHRLPAEMDDLVGSMIEPLANTVHIFHTQVDFIPVVNKELTLRGTYAYTPLDFARAIELLLGGRIEVRSWVQVMPLEVGPQAFADLATHPGSLIRAILVPERSKE